LHAQAGWQALGACYVASWPIPRPDLHRLADDSFAGYTSKLLSGNGYLPLPTAPHSSEAKNASDADACEALFNSCSALALEKCQFSGILSTVPAAYALALHLCSSYEIVSPLPFAVSFRRCATLAGVAKYTDYAGVQELPAHNTAPHTKGQVAAQRPYTEMSALCSRLPL